MKQTRQSENKKMIMACLKGAFVSVCLSLVCILVFAFIIKLTNMSENLIKPINQVIKIISIFAGTTFTLKKNPQKELICSMLVGLLYTLLAFVIFSILNGKFSFGVSVLIDAIFGTILGAICGVICKVVKK